MVKQLPDPVLSVTPHSANSTLPKISASNLTGAPGAKCGNTSVNRSLGASEMFGERGAERTAPASVVSLMAAETTNSYRAVTLLGETIDATGWRLVKNSSITSSEASAESQEETGGAQTVPNAGRRGGSEPVRSKDIHFSLDGDELGEDADSGSSGGVELPAGRRTAGTGADERLPLSQKSSLSSRAPRPIGQAVRFVGSTSNHSFMRSIEAINAQNARMIQEAEERSRIFDSNQWIHKMESAEVLYNRRRAPKFIGPYVMGDVLGEGSYGKVREGFCSITLKRVAVKIMKRKKLRKIPNGEINVKRELSLLRRLQHKNVISLVDVLYNNEKQKMYMVLEYCAGMLQEILDRADGNKLPLSQVHSYFLQLMEGIHHLHNNGIVHRDIKPHNLLILRDGTLKISDFGVAEELSPYDESDVCTTSSGTPAFQPPEIAVGKEQFSGMKCDIWSCGVTLYNMISGKYPFEGDNIYSLFESIAKAEYTVPDEADDVITDLLHGMLEKDINKRMTALRVLAHPWLIMPQVRSENEVPVSASVDDLNEETALDFKAVDTTLLPYLDEMYTAEDESLAEAAIPEEQDEFFEEEDADESAKETFESPMAASPYSVRSAALESKDASPRKSKWNSLGLSFGSSTGNDSSSYMSARSDKASPFRPPKSPGKAPTTPRTPVSAGGGENAGDFGAAGRRKSRSQFASGTSDDAQIGKGDQSPRFSQDTSLASPGVRRGLDRRSSKQCYIM